MQKRYIGQARSNYLGDWTEGQYCLGTKEACADYEEDATRLPWTTTTAPDNLSQLIVLPSLTQLKKRAFPKLLEMSLNLDFLQIPYPMIEMANYQMLQNTRVLALSNEYEYSKLFDLPKITWPRDLILDKLEGLVFFAYDEATVIWHKLNLSYEHVANVKYLKTYIDLKGAMLPHIEVFRNLEHIEATGLKNADLLSVLPLSLKVLHINTAGQRFSFAKLPEFKALEIANLLNIRAEIDCKLFVELPNIKEINLISCKKLRNIEALLDCESLVSLQLLDCNKPLNKELKILFKEHGFERLEIERA